MPPPTAGWSDRGRAPAGATPASEPDPFARIVEGDNVAIAMPPGGVHASTGVSSWSSTSSSRGPRRESLYRTLAFRRTIIPILLTLGVSLPALAGWWCLLDRDAPLKQTGAVVPITLLVVGVVLLLLAILNMLYVRHELQRAAPG
jgi:hypothetical protein